MQWLQHRQFLSQTPRFVYFHYNYHYCYHYYSYCHQLSGVCWVKGWKTRSPKNACVGGWGQQLTLVNSCQKALLGAKCEPGKSSSWDEIEKTIGEEFHLSLFFPVFFHVRAKRLQTLAPEGGHQGVRYPFKKKLSIPSRNSSKPQITRTSSVITGSWLLTDIIIGFNF